MARWICLFFNSISKFLNSSFYQNCRKIIVLRFWKGKTSNTTITFYTFLPLVVDTFGGWHKVGLKTITRLGRQLARNLGKDEEEVVCHLRQRLGVLIARDNAAMMASRHPTFAPPEVDGDPD